MSYELKMQGVGNGKRSRLYKKTKRASMNKIDATHLPMRVQSDKRYLMSSYINVITMLIVVLSWVGSMYLTVFSIIKHLRRG